MIDSGIRPGGHEDTVWPGALIALSALVVYAWTAYPSIAGGDSGELVGAACSLGVAHPPGYPLFTLLGHAASLLPVGSVAWRVNLVSALCSASAVLLMYLTVLRLTRAWPAAMLSAGLLAFAPLAWRYSIQAEVFALNTLFVVGLLYLFVVAGGARSERPFLLYAFVAGLALTNHHTIVFVAVPLGLWLLWQRRATALRPGVLAGLVASGLLGLAPYLYLVWASARAPLISWGDLTTWDGFLTHLLRREYGTFQLASAGVDSTAQLVPGLALYVQSLAQQLLYAGIVVAIVGLDDAWRLPSTAEREATGTGIQPRRVVLACFVLALVYLVFFHSLANLPFVDGPALFRDIVSRFWLMPHALVLVVLGWGWASLHRRWPSAGPVLTAVAALAVVAQFAVHFSQENQHANHLYADLGRDLLRPVPDGSVLLTLGDANTNSVRYLQVCEGHRPGVATLDRSIIAYPWAQRIVAAHYPSVRLPALAYHPAHPQGYTLKQFFEANLGRAPLYLTPITTAPDVLESRDRSWQQDFVMLPYGLTRRVIRTTDPVNVAQYVADTADLMVDMRERFPEPPDPASWAWIVYEQYWSAHYERASMVLKLAMLENYNPAHLETARSLLAGIIEARPGSPADWYKDLGIAAFHLERQSEGPQRERLQNEMIAAFRVYLAESTDRDSETYRQIRQLMTPFPPT